MGMREARWAVISRLRRARGFTVTLRDSLLDPREREETESFISLSPRNWLSASVVTAVYVSVRTARTLRGNCLLRVN